MNEELHATAQAMVSRPRGILAADESIGTMSTRLEKVGVAATAENRRDYREMLVTTPQLHRGISGVILSDETFNQKLNDGNTFPLAIHALDVLPRRHEPAIAPTTKGARSSAWAKSLNPHRLRVVPEHRPGDRSAIADVPSSGSGSPAG